MKQINGHASSVVAAPVESCFALLEAVHSYPTWNGELVREVEVLEWAGEGHPARARAMLHVAQSPFGKDFELVVAVRTEPPRAVYLTRLRNEPSDPEQLTLAWRLEPATGARERGADTPEQRDTGVREPGSATRIELEFHATVSFLPRFLPHFGVGDAIADTLLDAAVRALAPPP
jgi:Polyketide cyclase / dehydrase and lipid transport